MEELIKNLFVDKWEYSLNLICKYGLREILHNLISVIELKISKESYNNGINGISSSFLTNLNTNYLSKITIKEEKEDIEYIIREISMHYLFKYIESVDDPKSIITKNLQEELKSTCELNGYDYYALNKIFPVDDFVKFANVNSNTDLLNNPPVFYYDWKGLPHDFDDLKRNLKSSNCISSTAEFKKIFSKHNGDISISFNRDNIDFLIILFELLYERRLILPKGKNCGKFHPLNMYGVDFHESQQKNRAFTYTFE